MSSVTSDVRPRTKHMAWPAWMAVDSPLSPSHPISLGDPPTIAPPMFVCGGPRGRSRPLNRSGADRTDHSPTSATAVQCIRRTNPRGRHGDGKRSGKSHFLAVVDARCLAGLSLLQKPRNHQTGVHHALVLQVDGSRQGSSGIAAHHQEHSNRHVYV